MPVLDPYHFDVDPEVLANEVEGPEIGDLQGAWIPLNELIARGGAGLPLREHYGPGNHKSGSPQSSHNMGPDAVANTADKMMSDIASDGGTSVRTAGTSPSSGIMVSYPPGSGHNVVIDIKRTSEAKVQAQVEEFVRAQQSFVTSQSDRYLGGWEDSGKLHLDVSRNFPSSRREQAISAGRRQNQIAVFDLDTFTEIPTGGSGE